MAGFADLRVHSHYSYRDGVCSVEELVAHAAANGRPALALTDHNLAAGYIELQEAATRHGINPIFGVDLAIAWTGDPPDNRERARYGCGAEALRIASNDKNGLPSYDLVLLARDNTGLQNLFKLLTIAGTSGYDRSGNDSPLLFEEELLAHSAGLALLSGGACAKLPLLLARGDEKGALEYASKLREAFGSHFYVELPAHQSAHADDDRARLAKFARAHNLPLLATSDVHYLHPEQNRARDLLWAIADNGRLDDPQRRKPSADDARPLSDEELAAIFEEWPEALENAATLAASCTARLPKAGLTIPDYSLPSGFATAGEYLNFLTRRGLEEQIGQPSETANQRLDYELGVIERAGFSQYILIVADIVREAKEQKILCAPRGSSAGSLVCYALGITPLNPLDYNLLFERFLNEERLAPPDIDLDIADDARPRLLDYVVRRYGVSNVAHIITQNFEGAKSALRDAGKALGSDPLLVNRLVGLVPIEYQRPYTLSRTLEEVVEVSQMYRQDTATRTLIDTAKLIEGTGRNFGTHAAGVVITPRPVEEYVPLIRTAGLGQRQREHAGNDLLFPSVMTQWDMGGVEKRGLLKIDLLGLTAWTTIGLALENIRRERGLELDVWKLPVNNEETFRSIAQGYTIGIFQLENPGMTEFAMGMKPHSVVDLALMIAAYRPGPMPFLGKILAVRNGREKLDVPHPLLAPLLAESYGAPIYQETMLRIAREVAGYSLGEADVLRKAIGKKNQAELIAQRQKFLTGARQRGLTENEAESIWQIFPPFAFYGFNQAHAIIYGYLTYITAYLKINYPAEYLGALLTVAGGDTESIVKAVAECRRLKVALLGPDINQSMSRIAIETLPDGQKGLRLGLETVKGLGPAGVEAIIAARREGGDFTGLAEFIKRVPGRAVNSRSLTALARVGAFPFGARAAIEASIPAAQKAAKAKTFSEPPLPEQADYPLETQLTYEFELMGFHLTSFPVAETIERLTGEGKINTLTAELAVRENGQVVKMAGAVMGGRYVQARFGQMFVFSLEDGHGTVEVTVLPRLLKEYAGLLKEGRLLLVEGKTEIREGWARLQATRLETV